MRKHLIHSVVISVALLVVSTPLFAQDDKGSRPSPPANAECKFASGKTIKVDYSSPRARGRKIFGGVVPYDKVWRTGANEATSFVTTADLTIGNVSVPAGNYTMYTLPSEHGWKLIINKQTGQWGTVYDEKQDLARIDMESKSLSSPVANFTIAFDQTGGGDTCRIHLDWEKTSESAEIKEKR